MKKTAKNNFKKISLEEAKQVTNKLISEIEYLCDFIEVSGSIRREITKVGDIDIVVIPKNVSEFITKIQNHVEYDYGGTKKIFGIYMGRPINIFITTNESKGACLYQTTGPVFYNVRKRTKVKSMGYKLNEYGLFHVETNEKVAGDTENSIFDFFGWSRKEPKLRV